MTVPTTTTQRGQSLRYLRDQFSQYEMEVERVLGVDAYDLLNLEAERVPLGSEGLIILPYLMGERTPITRDVHARGVIFGLSLHHGKGHLVRAMMEAVAYALYDSFRLIRDSGLPIQYPIVLNEGSCKSRLWRRIITDVFNVPVLLKRRTGAPFGDAIPGRRGHRRSCPTFVWRKNGPSTSSRSSQWPRATNATWPTLPSTSRSTSTSRTTFAPWPHCGISVLTEASRTKGCWPLALG